MEQSIYQIRLNIIELSLIPYNNSINEIIFYHNVDLV
jgi:hypothetical protein